MLVKTVTCKLLVTEESCAALAETMALFNTVCNRLSEIAWETKTFRSFDLQRVAYHSLRAEFGLPAQLTIRAIKKVCDSYRVDRSVQHLFGMRGAVIYDARCFKLHDVSVAELTTIDGRLRFSLAHGGKQRDQLAAGTTGEADLLHRDGNYYLAITAKTPEPPAADTSGGFLGVDLGIVELATDSEGASYSGEAVKSVRRRVKRVRRLLQSKGTKPAKRHLKKIRMRQSRFVRDTNHCIAKKLVKTALSRQKALALEDLTGIRERGSGLNRETRWLLGNWAFADLGAKIAYKAAEAGIPVVLVDPRDTSRTCSRCGHCDKANRRSQSHFLCLHCGLDMNADFNAALNIEARAALSDSLLFPLRPPGKGLVVGEGQAAPLYGLRYLTGCSTT
jgi:IS605 OrfB family transposase